MIEKVDFFCQIVYNIDKNFSKLDIDRIGGERTFYEQIICKDPQR